VNDLLTWLRRRLANFLQRIVTPPDICYSVSDPGLVHPGAQIRNSTLHGKVTVGKSSIIKDSFISGSEVSIGRNTSLWGPNIDIYCMLNPVRIGSFCSVARNVSMQEYNHRIDRCSTYFFAGNVFRQNPDQDVDSRGPISIGNDVWIGSHVVIVSGASIGDGAIIGANSVVNGSIPPYAIAAGSPAKIIRYRFEPEIIARLLALQWWDWDDERIKRNRELFLSPMSPGVLDRVQG
jgi:virginiamycin A acetyltransferase